MPIFAEAIEIQNSGSLVTILLDPNAPQFAMSNSTGSRTIWVDAHKGNVVAGSAGTPGTFVVANATGEGAVRLKGDTAAIWAGGDGLVGSLSLLAASGSNLAGTGRAVFLDGNTASATLGGNGVMGDIALLSDKGEDRVRLTAKDANIWLGGHGKDGDLRLFPAAGDNATVSKATVHLGGDGGRGSFGGNGTFGDLELLSDNGKSRIRLNALESNVFVGGHGKDGDIYIFPKGGDNETTDKASIHLSGDAGDIVLRNADCAEEFDILGDAPLEPGTVVTISDSGALGSCDRPYDRRVAGVISGAGSYKPGIVLDRQPSSNVRQAIALVGKVFCKVDADLGAIVTGDLLTTSPTAGHAMKVTDPVSAVGAIIGKALAPLGNGCGLIPILVATR